MPNTKAAAKTVRQDAKRNLRNRQTRSLLKGLIKKTREAVKGGDAQTSEDAYKLAAKRIDQSAAKKRIHKNKANRLKSRLAKLKNTKAAAK